mmetsp:Transcript_25067/g.22139  ORF Transcript_25067/g.22139 Transcript_25067/m.22139 type:complete len:109 (+) Transcript_25067:177-503(+)
MTYDKIVELNKQIKKKINELKRAEIKWDIVLKNSFFLEDVIESEHSIDWRIRSAFFEERRGKFGKIMDHLEWLWYVKLQKIFFFFMGIACTFFSVLVFLYEIFTFEDF